MGLFGGRGCWREGKERKAQTPAHARGRAASTQAPGPQRLPPAASAAPAHCGGGANIISKRFVESHHKLHIEIVQIYFMLCVLFLRLHVCVYVHHGHAW